MIRSRRAILTIADYYFDEALPAGNRADILRYIQWSAPVPGCEVERFVTRIISLSEPKSLLDRFDRGCRYEIRRADSKDNLNVSVCRPIGQEAIDAFCAFYDSFAAVKRLPRAPRRRLQLLAAADSLDFSSAVKDGENLVWHSYVRVNGRVRLMHSASLYRHVDSPSVRQLIGRANRYLHWRDMLHFAAEGVSTYDLGGWYVGSEDEERQKINAFKGEFGGQVVCNFNCLGSGSRLGHLVVAAQRRLKSRWV